MKSLRLLTLCIICNCGLSLGSNIDYLSLFSNEDQVCNPSGLSFRYSGIRVYQTMLYDWPVRHFWYIVRCHSGRAVSQQYFATPRGANFPFATALDLSKKETYVFARKKKFVSRNVPVFRPYVEVGSIYEYDSTKNTTLPLAALYADNTAFSFTQPSQSRSMKFVPLLFSWQDDLPGTSSGSAEWRQSTNPDECFPYEPSDYYTFWWATNEFINTMANMMRSTTDKVVFWEFDSLQHQLQGTDWRRILSELVPDL